MTCQNCNFENPHSHVAHITCRDSDISRYTFNIYYQRAGNDTEYLLPYASRHQITEMIARAKAGIIAISDIHLAHVH